MQPPTRGGEPCEQIERGAWYTLNAEEVGKSPTTLEVLPYTTPPTITKGVWGLAPVYHTPDNRVLLGPCYRPTIGGTLTGGIPLGD